MITYWNILKDEEILLNALKTQRDELKDNMESLSTQADIYQNFYDSKVSSLLSGADMGLQDRAILQKRFAYNVIGVVTDSLISRVSKLKPKPSFISNSYLYSQKSKIKTLDVKVLSNMKKQDLYKKGDIVMTNGYIQNVGVLKTVPGDDEVLYFPVEIKDFYIYKPYTNSQNMKVIAGDKTMMTLYSIYTKIYPNMTKARQKKFIEKYNLEDIKEQTMKAEFKDHEIEVSDFYYVDPKHGRRVVFTDECILEDEKWDYDFIPYDFCYYRPPQRGVVGVGLSEILTPLQQRLNTLLKKISKSLDISFYPILLAHISSRVQRKITDEAGQIVTWEGARPPEQLVQAITHPQAFEHLDHLIHMMYRTARMDETAVATSAPANVNKASGTAIKNLETAEQSKVYQPSKVFEDFIISVAKKTARYIIKENYDDISNVIKDDKKFFKNINTWPVSLFPSTPEGKFQRAEFLIQAGLMTPEEIADLYDFPELAGSVLAQKGSKISAIYSKVERAISEDHPISPDPILGYQKQIEIAEGIYGKLTIEPEKYDSQLQKLRTFIGICSTELKKEQMQALQEQAAIQNSLAPPPVGGPSPAGPQPEAGAIAS